MHTLLTFIHLLLEVEESNGVIGTAHGQGAISRQSMELGKTVKSCIKTSLQLNF